MSGFRVVVCGGGIAAVEALLRLRRAAPEEVDVTVVSPEDELRYRPLAVQEPFARPGARRYPLREIASRVGADLLRDALEWVDGDGQVVHTAGGEELPYDALLLAVGARSVPALDHVTTFDDAHADETFLGIVKDIEDGYSKNLALVVPEGPTWSLPVYELALQTADRAHSAGFDDVTITVITPEDAPLEVFGEPVAAAVHEVLTEAGVRLITGSRAEVPANRRLVVHPGDLDLEPELIVALPRMEGRAIRGLPSVHGGFVPIDDSTRVVGMGEHVFAAGDTTDFPVKQGGLGAQQADVAAANVAALAGDHDREKLEPVLRGALIAGERRSLYFEARLENGRPVDSQVLDEPPWSAAEKVVAEELGPFLQTLDEQP
ncbi:MAG TPA: FAD-dependent oxidoreductase [Thermoleophilaceae bacterium]|nr:FAD-dependent oxidoreductase [Thermoleophilaceae bacterium]